MLAYPHPGFGGLGVDRHHTEWRDDDVVDVGTSLANRDGMYDIPAVLCGPPVQLAADLPLAFRAHREGPGRCPDS